MSYSVELRQPELTAPQGIELKQSIFESYDPLNEAERIQKLSHLTPEQQRYYISENLQSYFEEFAAEIKVKKLAGVLKDDGSIEMLGTNVTEMYNHSAALAGPNSREAQEKNGLDTITKGLRAGNNRALWISPPKVADYGFGLMFIADDYDSRLGGRPFRELLLRYDEDMGSVSQSTDVYRKMKYSLGMDYSDSENMITADDFLENPIIYSNHDSSDLENLYAIINISEQDAAKSERFRTELEPYIRPMMDEYVALIQRMSQYDLASRDEQIEMYEEQCKNLIGGMFNTARIISRRLQKTGQSEGKAANDEAQLTKLAYGAIDPQMMYQLAQQMAAYENLTITGGSNCLVTRGTGMMESSVLDAMNSGALFGSSSQFAAIMSEDKGPCVTCPYCLNEENNVKVKNKYVCGNKKCRSNKKK